MSRVQLISGKPLMCPVCRIPSVELFQSGDLGSWVFSCLLCDLIDERDSDTVWLSDLFTCGVTIRMVPPVVKEF